MSELSAFLKINAFAEEEVAEYVASNRFRDENGEPIAWKLKAVSSATDEFLRKDATKKVSLGKRNQYTKEFDNDKYLTLLVAETVTYPDLNNAELQDSYGVKSAVALLKAMLKPGEYVLLQDEVMRVNGFDLGFEDEVEEAKN